jgi:predicted aldo/keto reductase-like oxidoreductase
MQYRHFGNTGFDISALGFGCMRLPEFEKDGKWFIDEDKAIPLLLKAYEEGVNYFDTAFYYCRENSQYTVGKALKKVRDKVKISTKIPLGHEVEKTEDYRKMLEETLRRMDTDYIDFYHFWGINKATFDDKIVRLGLLKEAQKAKDEGLIRHISFSFHDEPENMKYIIDKGEILETVLCQYNLLDRSHEEVIAYAASKGLGVVAMGPVGGGRLAAPTELYRKLTGKESAATYELALRFVLGNPNIACALSGMENEDMLVKNLAVANDDKPMNKEEWEKIGEAMQDLKKFSDLYCTGCNYCQPCPQNINIPRIFNNYTMHNVYGLSNVAKNDYNHYIKHPNEGNPTDSCTDCGLCETKCPQRLQIRDQLKRVDSILRAL